MRTGKMTNRILGIALVAVLIGTMLPLGAFGTHNQVKAAPAGDLHWQSRTPMPTPRSWTDAVTYHGLIYVVGGCSCLSDCRQFYNAINSMEVYNPETNTWQELTPMSVDRVGPAVAALNGKIYVMGGFNRSTWSANPSVEIYDIATDTWSTGRRMPTARSWARAVVLDGKIYVLGGVGGHYWNVVEKYDPQTDTWTSCAPFSGGRYMHAAVAANGKIYVIGGDTWEGGPNVVYSDIQEYDPLTNSWTTRSPMPSAVSYIDGVAVGNEIWVFGREICWVYDVATDQWSERNSGHYIATGLSVEHHDGFIYRFGGGGWGPTLDIVEAVDIGQPTSLTFAKIWQSEEIGQVTCIALEDINGNGRPEIIVGTTTGFDAGTYTYHGRVYIFNALTHELEWKSDDIGYVRNIEVADLNGDGNRVIVAQTYLGRSAIIGHCYGHVHIFDPATQAEIWKSESIGQPGGDLVVADLDGDGISEIIAGAMHYYSCTRNGHVYVFSGDDFSLRWKSIDVNSIGAIAVGDIDGDGVNDIIFGNCITDCAYSAAEGGWYYPGHLYVIDGANFTQKWRSDDIGVAYSLVIADVNNDGVMEIVASVARSSTPNTDPDRGYVYVFDGQNYLPRWKSANINYPYLRVFDLDDDGIMEIVARTETGHAELTGIYEGHVYVFDAASFGQVWRSANLGVDSGLEIADLNNNGKREIVTRDTTGGGGHICVFSGVIYEEEWRSGNIGKGALAVADLNNNGLKEIVAGGSMEDYHGHLYIYAIVDGPLPPHGGPIARDSDISGQEQVMHPDEPYTVTAKYFDPDGREDLKYCYLQLKHPDKPLTMMWVQATDDFWVYAGELGETYLSVAGTSTEIEEGGLQGYELAWTFTIKHAWPEVENAIDFGVYAWDDSDLKSGWKYDDTKASFRLTPPEVGNVILTEPLTIFASSPYYPYEAGDVLYATFSITNRGEHTTTLDELVVGGRLGENIVDFPKDYHVTLNPGDVYQYAATLTLETPGLYYFFSAYYIANPTPEEERFLDENNWNTSIAVEVDGHIVEDDTDADLYRVRLVTVRSKGTYLTAPHPRLWQDLDGPWKQIQDGKEYEIRAVAADPAGQHLYVAIQRYKRLGLVDRYAISENIYQLSNGTWQDITGGLPRLMINALAVAPSRPGTVYVGGGRLGVYKYANGTWQSLNGPKGGRWPFSHSATVLSLSVDCADPDAVYVGTKGYGIWRRTQQNTWKNVWEAYLSVQFTEIVRVLTASPDQAGVIYASAERLYYNGSIMPLGALRSSDYGASWHGVTITGKFVSLGQELWDCLTVVSSIGVTGEGVNNVYVATNSHQISIPLIGFKGEPFERGYTTSVGFNVFADGLFMFDGEGAWDDKKHWHQASGRESANPLPEVDPRSVVVSSKHPNIVVTSFRDEIWFSHNHGSDWFPILKGERVRDLVLVDKDDGPILYAYGATKLLMLEMSDSAIIAKAHSPIQLSVYDCDGRVTGLVEGAVSEEIPSSMYCDKTVFLFAPTDCHLYVAKGVSEGHYGLTISSVTDDVVTTFTAVDVPTWDGAIHQYSIDWDALARGEDGVTISVDSDGDGDFDHTFTAGSELTGDQFILHTETLIDFDPNTLNLRGRGGGLVTVYIELPEDFDVHDIDTSTILLNGTVPALSWPTSIGDYNDNGVPDLMVKFDTRAVHEVVEVGEAVEITITGEVDGIPFMGVDTIRVIGQ